MTKGEKRKARKKARADGRSFEAETDRDRGPQSWTESLRGYRARYQWAKRYDALNGAPENDGDR